jgi:hypothetical protein
MFKLLKRLGPASVRMRAQPPAAVGCRAREEANAAHLARASHLLHSCSSDLERLELIAYLRSSSGDPRRRQLRSGITEDDFDHALKQLHLSTFWAWLMMPANKQLADIRLYLQDPEDARLMLNSLVLAGKMAVPPEAQQHEKELFNHQMDCIQASLGGSCSNVPLKRPLTASRYFWRLDQRDAAFSDCGLV